MENFSYCVAIRTLGKAREKYQQELESLVNQTIPPKRILIYIAEGYDLPKETIGVEEYIYVPKGMIAQRALPFHEVDTDYILLLDDDMYLAPDAVEKLYLGLCEKQGDCIAADIFKNQEKNLLSKLLAFVTNWAYPRPDDQYAFKIQRNASFSYNNSPSRDVYLSQSAAGAVSLWKLSSLRKVHFRDELWLDQFTFAYGDDLLFFYKLYVNGGVLLIHYNTGIQHLDAGSSRDKYNKDPKRLYYRSMIWCLLWWRTCYNRNDLSSFQKFISMCSFSAKTVWGMGLHIIYSLIRLNWNPIFYFLKGINDAWSFVHSNDFMKIPNFYLSNK